MAKAAAQLLLVLQVAAVRSPVAALALQTLSATEADGFIGGYKPVIMMHGVGSGYGEMATIADVIAAEHPGTVTTALHLFDDAPAALTPLQLQVDGVIATVRAMVAANTTLYANGYNFVCKSQGGLICRCVIEQMDDHRVDTFVSLAGPQAGVYGPAFFASFEHLPLLENVTAEEMWRVAYTALAQDAISVANMWRDPYHLPEYRSAVVFMQRFTWNATARFKANFARLKKALFCVGSGPSYDGGIEPWQTGVWGSLDPSTGRMLSMVDQPWYIHDTFGLKTLDSSGRLNLTVVPNASHADWTHNQKLIREVVIPHLG